MRETLVPFVTGIVVYFLAIVIQYGLRSPAVFETVQVYPYARLRQQPYLVKEVEYAPIVHGIGHIQAHDM
jgi:hypothetical protein